MTLTFDFDVRVTTRRKFNDFYFLIATILIITSNNFIFQCSASPLPESLSHVKNSAQNLKISTKNTKISANAAAAAEKKVAPIFSTGSVTSNSNGLVDGEIEKMSANINEWTTWPNMELQNQITHGLVRVKRGQEKEKLREVSQIPRLPEFPEPTVTKRSWLTNVFDYFGWHPRINQHLNAPSQNHQLSRNSREKSIGNLKNDEAASVWLGSNKNTADQRTAGKDEDSLSQYKTGVPYYAMYDGNPEVDSKLYWVFGFSSDFFQTNTFF